MDPLKLIKHALDTTIAQIQKGDKPTVALEKVARELDLNPNYIQRTGEALNVALHYNHFKKHASNKAADFAVADIPFVTKNIFGEKEKTLNQKKAEWFPAELVDLDYNKILTNPGFKKRAKVIKETEADFDTFDITFKGQYKKAAEHINRLDRELDEIKTDKVANEVYFEGSFFALTNGFKKSAESRIPFHEFESQVFSQYGDKSIPYLDLIYKTAALSEERGKHDSGYINFTPSKEAELFDSFLKSASKKVEDAKQVKEAMDYVDAQKDTMRQMGYQLNPMAQAFDKAACDIMADELDAFAEVLEKNADVIEKLAEGPTSSLVMNLFRKYSDVTGGAGSKSPWHANTKAHNHERTAVLQDLIMTDPILSKQEPRKIINAYQQILRLAPIMSREKEIVRAQLRAMMAGQALHPTEADQLINMDTSMMKHYRMSHETEAGDKPKDK